MIGPGQVSGPIRLGVHAASLNPAMSEKLDLVRSIFADWERGDFRSAEWADPDIELVTVGGPEPDTWKGLAGVAEFTRDFLAAWSHIRLVADEYLEVDDERVVVLLHYSGSGTTSGLDLSEVGSAHANIFHIRAGKVTRYVVYWEYGRAFADLGMSE